ncbi:hypothetical protein M758_UG078700 [Ceratodon purpureus]|uniref:Uncharacterized protein n=1 Tax=Ceratodon purpureus TaxID=3225 RepID=A0A8T0I5Y9_CERPU|nr:hypothetical protein KC19_4G071400 [Ceratodon purpureus]KAG0594452.1 hypothetical protein M758_UG078700 [Ceratodon purpureus]
MRFRSQRPRLSSWSLEFHLKQVRLIEQSIDSSSNQATNSSNKSPIFRLQQRRR